MRLWIKNPLAILASGAEGGIVVEGSRIIELVPAGSTPARDHTFDASRHVVIPGPHEAGLLRSYGTLNGQP